MSNPARPARRRALHWLAGTALVGGASACGGGSERPRGATDGALGSGRFADGGTDLIRADYPDTALFAQSPACRFEPTPASTEGPCYFADDSGEDISAGQHGLPMQLCLRVIDRHCRPLADRLVEVWHTDPGGAYSGDTRASSDASRFAGTLCTLGDSAAARSRRYRGQLRSDGDGRVNFKSCFPGWYSGRPVHIHFAVSEPDGRSRFVSQFGFDDALAREVYTTHARYRARGDQNTPLATGRDPVFPATGYRRYLFNTALNEDGSLRAWHSIQIG